MHGIRNRDLCGGERISVKYEGKKSHLVVGISGASGALYGIRLLEMARDMDSVETHLVITPPAQMTIAVETDRTADDVAALADHVYDDADLAAPLASGSFPAASTVIIPCSIKSLSAIANCYASTLLARTADVTLKEGRPLILVVRETPLHLGHLRLMVDVAEMGGIIFPPVPALYGRPESVDEIIDATAGRILARLGFPNSFYPHWSGLDVEKGKWA